MKALLLVVLLGLSMVGHAHEGTALRRVISPDQPAWIIHIDVWNYADPQKIIDMVPEDVRPYVIFNIATSSSDDKSTDGPAIYDSWMKVCAQNRVWTMIQCASGYFNRMPDTADGLSAYEHYFQNYPNFLGFNFAEQYWGFDGNGEGAVTFDSRLRLFAKLLPLCHTYGGYLAVSFADSYYNADKMPIAYLRRNSELNSFLTTDSEHFLCFEKFTQKKNFLFNESHCLGAWLSGVAGQYGIRFDSSGWVETGVKPDAADGATQYTLGASDFVRAAGAIPVAEHMMLTGQTIMDGPELSWTECSIESATTTVDGYTCRNWQWMPQWQHVTLDLFRKVLDGTIRVMSRQEVTDRTKVCVVNNGEGTASGSYRIPAALYDGLYRNEKDYGGVAGTADNHWLNNRWWMKSTGRYPTIPQMPEVGGLTDISSYVSNDTAKQNYMNSTFPEEYTGDIFAGRQENGWVTYNPYQYDDVTANGIRTLSKSTQRAKGVIPFQYNTCESVELDYAPYSLGIMKEYGDKVTFYLSNYEGGKDIIKINGASDRPSYTSNGGVVSESWEGGIYTLSVEHSGAAVELTVNCVGTATGRKTAYTTANITAPALPAVYEGTLQYEAELADYKSTTIRKSGYNMGRDGYYGQGFAELTGTQSALRFAVVTLENGYYLVSLRYQADKEGKMKIGDETLVLPKTDGWQMIQTFMQLNEGVNRIVVTNAGGTRVYMDCLTIDKIKTADFTPDSNGEYHVKLEDLTASGCISLDAQTGIITQTGGSTNESGALCLFFNRADFSSVSTMRVTYEGEGDIFRYLLITDYLGQSVNTETNLGAFWSSKYRLNYADYQDVIASRQVCKIEWNANAPVSTARTMTIKDIVFRMEGSTTGISSASTVGGSAPVAYFTLQGQQVDKPGKGIHIVKLGNGKTMKKHF